jgi:uncharacterized RDD family membrane protein YckC
LETPEGVDLTLTPAGPLPRILAYTIDLLIRTALLIALSLLLSMGGEAGIGILTIFAFLAEWFYPVFFEVFSNGKTPGKSSMGLRVVHDDGTPVVWSTSIIRNLLRAADFLPLMYLVGLTSMLMNRPFKRLGDLAAGTLVIYDQMPHPFRNHNWAEEAQAPCVPLTAEEQRALLQFAERRDSLSESRQIELAEILKPLTGKDGVESLTTILRIANGIGGNG